MENVILTKHLEWLESTLKFYETQVKHYQEVLKFNVDKKFEILYSILKVKQQLKELENVK